MILHYRRASVALAFALAATLGTVFSRAATISYFRFEEGYGSTTADETGLMSGEYMEGNQNGGFNSDVPFSTVPLTGANNAYSIYFSGGFVDFSTGTDLNLGMSFTIECFYNALAPGIASSMFGLGPGNSLSVLLAQSGDDLYLSPRFQGSIQYFPASLMTLNTWQHFALVKEPGEFSVYIDGLLQYNGALPDGTDGPYDFWGNNLTGDRTIGGNNGTWNGWIDEFRISDEALTPGQFLNAIPEPSTMGLMLFGAAGLAWRKRRK